MTENEPENAELRRIKERKRISDKKYYDNKKLKEAEYEPKNEPENKIKNNNIECIPKENIKKEDSDLNEWLWDTTIGAFKMLGQTIIQSFTTIAIPALIMWMMPRNITQQITSSSQVALKQSEKDTKTQQTVSSLSQLM